MPFWYLDCFVLTFVLSCTVHTSAINIYEVYSVPTLQYDTLRMLRLPIKSMRRKGVMYVCAAAGGGVYVHDSLAEGTAATRVLSRFVIAASALQRRRVRCIYVVLRPRAKQSITYVCKITRRAPTVHCEVTYPACRISLYQYL